MWIVAGCSTAPDQPSTGLAATGALDSHPWTLDIADDAAPDTALLDQAADSAVTRADAQVDAVAPDAVTPDAVTPDAVGTDAVAPDAVTPDASPGCPATCVDKPPCAKAACDQGKCVWTLLQGPCDDGAACTTGDTCQLGECKGVDACKLAALAKIGQSPCQVLGGLPSASAIQLQPWFTKLQIPQPIHMVPFPDGSDRLVFVSRSGQLRLVDNKPDVVDSKLMLDLGTKVSTQGEGGLLSVAFHPDFKVNHKLYVDYTILGTTQSVISELTMKVSDPETVDPASEVVLLQVAQPYTNHDGGQLLFDTAGMLLIGFGDGGSAGDPLKSGQDKKSLLGKILRIDVDSQGLGKKYAIPKDNPFVGNPEFAPEVFALGMRNPWRFSADRVSGTVWIGDVGQNKYEEIDILQAGANYGWNTMEGNHCFAPATGCAQAGLTLPVVELPHGQANSITGGYVYRGSQNKGLYGAYIFGDYSTGKFWSTTAGGPGGWLTKELVDTTIAPVSFGEDRDGELYVIQLYPAAMYKVVEQAVQPPPGPALPTLLSKTGCFALPSMAPAPGVVPYEVNTPLWSDGAAKQRWLVLPPGSAPKPGDQPPMTAPANAYASWDFPVGTLLIKHFALGDSAVPVETRFLRRDAQGWTPLTYRWNPLGTDAELLLGGSDVALNLTVQGKPTSQVWHVPSLGQCAQCHVGSGAQLGPLGLQTAQLQRPAAWTQGQSQLAVLAAAGLLSGTQPGDPALADLTNAAISKPPAVDLNLAARSYLHANCSHCHRPGGKTGADMDMRFDTPLAKMGVCGAAPQKGDVGVPTAKLLQPGSPVQSVLYLRMSAAPASGWLMPTVGVNVPHPAGAKLIADWISSLGACPP